MKNNILKVIIGLVFLILFNALFFFLGGTEQSAVNWVCYSFIHAAYLCILITPLFCNLGKGLSVLSASLYLRALFFFIIELSAGLICMAIAPEKITWPCIILGTFMAIFLVLQMMSVLANDATRQSIQKQKEESDYIQTLVQKLRSRMRDITDVEAKKQVERCYEALNNSPIESFPEARGVEQDLSDAVSALCVAIEEGDIEQIEKKAKRVNYAVQDRNTAIRRYRI